MKRINVSPDLLASMTAEALFDRKPDQALAKPVDSGRGSRLNLGRWFKPGTPNRGAAERQPAFGQALDNDWVGGWYAKSRHLQAATLANFPGRKTGDADPTADDVATDGNVTADVVTQIKDLS